MTFYHSFSIAPPQQWCGQTQPHPQHTWTTPQCMYANCAGHS